MVFSSVHRADYIAEKALRPSEFVKLVKQIRWTPLPSFPDPSVCCVTWQEGTYFGQKPHYFTYRVLLGLQYAADLDRVFH